MGFCNCKTTIVLGAGASKEAGLPVGRELKTEIATLLDIRYPDGYARKSGSGIIDAAFRKIADPITRNINPYLHASWQIRDAMPQAISIDNYLDAHAADDQTVIAGKLAIAQAILEAERTSLLFFERTSRQNIIDFKRLEDSWFNKFFQLLTENCKLSDLPESLANVSVVSFNYDRCLEQFLYFAIQNYYRISAEGAADLLQNFCIFHPYGSVGSLPWQKQSIPIEFGSSPSVDHLVEIQTHLRTFNESIDPDTSNIEKIHCAVSDCDQLIFLGFAYHPMNMKLLSPQKKNTDIKKSFGTALGLSQFDCKVVENEIVSMIGGQVEMIELRNDMKCSQLFDEYRRSLTTP